MAKPTASEGKTSIAWEWRVKILEKLLAPYEEQLIAGVKKERFKVTDEDKVALFEGGEELLGRPLNEDEKLHVVTQMAVQMEPVWQEKAKRIFKESVIQYAKEFDAKPEAFDEKFLGTGKNSMDAQQLSDVLAMRMSISHTPAPPQKPAAWTQEQREAARRNKGGKGGLPGGDRLG